jgi:pterin-4a-carbinolamine dehydratase
MNLKDLMNGYLAEGDRKPSFNPLRGVIPEAFTVQETLPLSVEEALWRVEQQPERLIRLFSFPKTESRNWFISEVLEKENEMQHSGKITIDGLDVLIEVYTHDLEKVTELDKEYASYCDDVFNDVQLVELKGNR